MVNSNMQHDFIHGFSAAPNELLRDPTLSSNAKLCLSRLIGYENCKSEHICPKISTLAAALGMKELTVKRALKVLKDRDLIVSTQRGKKLSNIYDIIYQQEW